jgi:hypothetical protein
MKAFIYMCILPFLLFTCGSIAIAQSFKRVAVIGSSTAYGYFPAPSPAYPQDSGWVNKLQAYYKRLSVVDTIFNLAALGRDCYSGMPTGYTPPAGESFPDINTNITKAVNLLPKPNAIIVNYPTNNYDRLDNDSIIQCLRVIKNEANANGIRCYIATTQPRNSFDSAGRQKLKGLRDLIITTFGIWAIDFFTPLAEEPTLNVLPNYDLGDNIHINPQGHTVLLSQVIAKDIFMVVLPVRFNYFTAKTVDTKILLNWATSFEQNNSQFIIEKSTNGNSFKGIALIKGRGTGDAIHQYQYSDDTKNLQGFFYRVVTINDNGNRQVSPIVFVAPASNVFTVGTPFPSPCNQAIHTQISVEGKKAIDIIVTNVSGKQVLHQQIVVNTILPYKLDVSNFSPGNYFISFSCNGQSKIVPFYKQ